MTDSEIERKRVPGDEGVWFFIVADTSMFAVLFLVFITARQESLVLFEQGRQSLSITTGFLNTLILLTSSLFMALAVDAARKQDRQKTITQLRLALVVGSLFAVSKVIEYGLKAKAGIAVNTNDFYMFYFGLTAIHFFHYLGGMLFLTLCLFKANDPTQFTGERYLIWIESSGCYWHMVDLLWIMLFPMIYLLAVPQ